MAQVRVLLNFAGAADHEVEELAGAVLDPDNGLYAHPTIYPAPPVAKVDLQAALSAFSQAIAAQAQGGTQATAAKEAARAVLVGLLRQLAAEVQKVLQGNSAYGLAELLLSGFDAVSTNRAQTQLDKPSIEGIDNTGEGRMKVRVTPVANARMYELQKKGPDDADYVSAGLFSSTRGMEVTGLTPGVMYTFRVGAKGGSTGQSEWSDPMSHRSL